MSTPGPVQQEIVAAPPRAVPSGDATQWFKQEVHPHGPQLKAWLRGQFPSVRDVDDVVQESFLRIWKARAAREIRSAKSFLFQIARHVAVDLLRRHKASPVGPLGDLDVSTVMDSGPDAAAILSIQEKLDLLADALVSLPPRCREVVFLHKIQGRSQKDVAQALGLSERTVENHTREGLIRLQRFMHAHGVHSFLLD